MSITQEQLSAALAQALSDFEKKQDEKLAARFKELSDSAAKKPEDAAMSEGKIDDALIALRADVAKVKQELAEKVGADKTRDAELAAAKEKLGAYQLSIDNRRIADLIELGLNTGVFDAKDVPGYGTESFDPAAWLDKDGRFKGIDGLKTHVARSGKPVSFAERRMSRPQSDTAPASLADVPFDPATFKDAAEFERFAGLGVGGDPRHAPAR